MGESCGWGFNPLPREGRITLEESCCYANIRRWWCFSPTVMVMENISGDGDDDDDDFNCTTRYDETYIKICDVSRNTN